MISNPSTTDPSFLTAPTTFEDSIAKICWHPVEGNNQLAVSSWDSKIRIYSVRSGPFIEEKTAIQALNPCLAVCWTDDPLLLATGSIDGEISLYDTQRGGFFMSLGKHEDAVQGIYPIPNRPLLCSVSYDKTLKFWDQRHPGPAGPAVNPFLDVF